VSGRSRRFLAPQNFYRAQLRCAEATCALCTKLRRDLARNVHFLCVPQGKSNE
jgi:hypothetical protein